jgi:hypothetical protein
MSAYYLWRVEIAMETRTFWIAAMIAGVFFPIISAVTMGSRNGGAWQRVVRSGLAYGVVFGLVYSGFAFQALIDFGATQDPYFPINLSWFDIAKIYLIGGMGSGNIGLICLLSLLIAWVTLFGKNRQQWAIFGCRAAFITYVCNDILVAIVNDSSIQTLIKDIIFDLVGAIIFGAFAAVFLGWIFPEARRNRSVAAGV